MGLRQRILRVVLPESGGDRKRNVLLGLARTPAEKARAGKIIDAMLERGELVMRGAKRGAVYGLPRRRKPGRINGRAPR